MSWTEQVFRYCERAQDPTFWAEPLNALSNVGFLVVAGLAALRLRAARARQVQSGSAGPGVAVRRASAAGAGTQEVRTDQEHVALAWMLVGLVAAIGIGSFLFHTFATRWARLADVVPIVLFMGVYPAFALRAFLGFSALGTGLALALFLVACAAIAGLACGPRLVTPTGFAFEPCLNGTTSYLPALLALVLVGWLLRRRHPAGRLLLAAAFVFLAAMMLRWVDLRACAATLLMGRPRGTHALWHLLNAATLHLLLRAAIAPPRPAGKRRGALPGPASARGGSGRQRS